MSVKLEHWVAAEHMVPETMLRYRQAIHQSSGRAAVIDNLLLPEKLAADMFDAAPEAERFYRYRNLRGPSPGRAMSPGMMHNALFTMLSRSAPWRDWLSGILGEPLARQTGMHARIMDRGAFMKQHGDGAHGRLCAVFYVGSGWEPAFGS